MKKIKAYDIETKELLGEYNTQQEVADAFDLTWEAVKSYFYREKIYGEAKIFNHNTDTWCYLVKEESSKKPNYKERCLQAIEYIKSLQESEVIKLNREEDAFNGLTKKQVAKNELVYSMIKSDKLLEILGADDENNR